MASPVSSLIGEAAVPVMLPPRIAATRVAHPREGDARVTLTGKYIVVWRRDGGGNWRLHRGIWNCDA